MYFPSRRDPQGGHGRPAEGALRPGGRGRLLPVQALHREAHGEELNFKFEKENKEEGKKNQNSAIGKKKK